MYILTKAAGGGEATTMEEEQNTTDAEKEIIEIFDGDQGGDVRETGEQKIGGV